MNFISAKEFRLNMKQIMLRASQGEEFTILYNSKPLAKLSSPNKNSREKVDSNKTGKKLAKILDKYSSSYNPFQSDPRTIKEIYHDMLIREEQAKYKAENEDEK